ncbi:MAG: class I mannose-6-phosphate isomerase [Cyclobacteriaceae bacterium]|nr:class I mannose-6-phosphate isomerase [Cyclobacteriaceae bacterium]
MQELYPLSFNTIYKDKIWGGQKIKTVLGKDFGNLPNCGETWEISGVPGNVSIVSNGSLKGTSLVDLIESYKDRLMGKKVWNTFGNTFPLLVKFIDANDDLSIQVHPDDQLAKKRHNSFGKTEMWYIFQADKGAKLNAGFRESISPEIYLEHLRKGNIMDILNWVDVYDDDVFFLPAGRVHSIGKGCLLAEIQQTSDVTYRIYDFERKDDQGNTRELHTEEALDAIDYKAYDEYKSLYEKKINEVVRLVTCNYFETNLLHCDKSIKRDYSAPDSFKIVVCMQGSMHLQWSGNTMLVEKGMSVLIPAEIDEVTFTPNGMFKMLESYIP